MIETPYTLSRRLVSAQQTVNEIDARLREMQEEFKTNPERLIAELVHEIVCRDPHDDGGRGCAWNYEPWNNAQGNDVRVNSVKYRYLQKAKKMLNDTPVETVLLLLERLRE